jgi:hypothetical protein
MIRRQELISLVATLIYRGMHKMYLLITNFFVNIVSETAIHYPFSSCVFWDFYTVYRAILSQNDEKTEALVYENQ